MCQRSPALHLNKGFTKFRHSLFNDDVKQYTTATLRNVMKQQNIKTPAEVTPRTVLQAEKKGLVLYYTDEFIKNSNKR